jgi:hypothetical protein
VRSPFFSQGFLDDLIFQKLLGQQLNDAPRNSARADQPMDGGVPRAQYVMLGAAVIFFGVIIEQNVEFLVSPIDLGGELPQARLFGAIVRSGVMIGLNFWVALSQPMRDFMLGARMERT